MRSAAANTRTRPVQVILVDDASPDWDHAWLRTLREECGLVSLRFAERGGLTRSWNAGLRLARAGGAAYAVVTNSDVIFPGGWDCALVAAVADGGYDLVGPVTNAPGPVEAQDFTRYYDFPFTPTDDPAELDRVSGRLLNAYGTCVHPSPLNGFCMLARTGVWWANRYDGDNVFRPRNDFSSTGAVNPTPLMTLNEDELQGRWRDRGLKTGLCPGSFVFHYRAVSRGDRYRSRGWFRAGAR